MTAGQQAHLPLAAAEISDIPFQIRMECPALGIQWSDRLTVTSYNCRVNGYVQLRVWDHDLQVQKDVLMTSQVVRHEWSPA